MLNLFSKTTSWMVASLLATTVAISAQDTTKGRPQKSYEQGHEVEKNQLMPAYNAPASISVRCSWDVYATGSFLYWQAREDNLELGIASNGDPLIPGGPFLPNPFDYAPATAVPFVNPMTEGRAINANYSYGPGFKLGLGMNLDYDNWDAYAEYTWFHKTSNTHYDLEADCECEEPDNRWIFPTRIMPVGLTTGLDSDRAYKAVDQSWNVKMDFLDLSLSRAYYSGTKLSFRPFYGVRGAWIRQKLDTFYSKQAAGVIDPLTGVATAVAVREDLNSDQYGSIRSWGVGPRAGFESNWMLGCGFRLIGDVSADILYTRYNVKSVGAINATYTTDGSFLPPLLVATGFSQGTLHQKHLDVLRPHADMEIGFGWGSYFDNSNWHFDLLATYGYQVFWNQNMFRFFSESHSGRSTNANGNLYVHGLTLTARFDF